MIGCERAWLTYDSYCGDQPQRDRQTKGGTDHVDSMEHGL